MAGKTFKEIKGLPGFCCFLKIFFNKMNECGGEVGKAKGGGESGSHGEEEVRVKAV